MLDTTTNGDRPVEVQRWSTERPLLVLIVLTAITIWVLLALSLIGIIYAVMIAALFFFSHVAFVAHLRGSGIRIGPEQMPELHARIALLASRIGLQSHPDAYVIQAGGQLNALATKFLGSHFIVLYSDLLEACGENTEARDFIIAHELGHLKSGHLRMRWLLLPGLAMPFLGTAYSRACEFTCDRFGFAISQNKTQSLDGLTILAAGAQHGRRVNRKALVAQRRDLNTFWMKIGQWLSTHPPIATRLAVLEPSLTDGTPLSPIPTIAAATMVVLLLLFPAVSTLIFIGTLWPQISQNLDRQLRMATARTDPEGARADAESDILSLVDAAEDHRGSLGVPPKTVEELYDAWTSLHHDEPELIDPFDGQRYGYNFEDGEYRIWSAGPDPEDPDDNIYYSSLDARQE